MSVLLYQDVTQRRAVSHFQFHPRNAWIKCDSWAVTFHDLILFLCSYVCAVVCWRVISCSCAYSDADVTSSARCVQEGCVLLLMVMLTALLLRPCLDWHQYTPLDNTLTVFMTQVDGEARTPQPEPHWDRCMLGTHTLGF